jgi:hypothetical protein
MADNNKFALSITTFPYWRWPSTKMDPLGYSIRRKRRRLLISGAAVLVLLLALFVTVVGGWPNFAGRQELRAYGQSEPGKSLAVVHVGAKTAYFPAVACSASSPEVLTVSLGVEADRISFYLAAFLGPQETDGRYVAPITSLVKGHRPGIVFDQNGSGSVIVSPQLVAQLRVASSTRIIAAGTLSFTGTDVSRVPLSGNVVCLAA